MERAFPLFGLEHWALLAATFGIPGLLAWIARRSPPGVGEGIRYVLAALLAANVVASVWLGILWRGGFPPRESLPMHMCDWAIFVTIAALLTKSRRIFELAYFWGLAGTFQGILTPDLSANEPLLRYLTFFVTHCGIVVAVLFLTWGLRLRPERGAFLRIFLWTQLYVLVAAMVNWTTGGNYGYLCGKPQSASILDHLGPWPWYLISLELVGLLLFALLYLPFVLTRNPAAAESSVHPPKRLA